LTARTACAVGAALAGIAVAAGAFGAHILSATLPSDLLLIFETAARYQMWHGLALFLAGLAARSWPAARLGGPSWMLLAGTVVFSGSLYVLALTGVRALGAVTPIGGVLLIAGWAMLAWRLARAGTRSTLNVER
jgi:uncharacterized membrane protein YgdD (TMEM256/DUF423 family)